MPAYFEYRQMLQHCKPTLTIIFAAIIVLFSSWTFAQAATPAGCDPAYWNAMKSRAWMEAEREIAQNQSLIYKADSVLEYSCFDEFLKVLASNAANIFTENTSLSTAFSGPAGIDNRSMDRALERLVGLSLANYANAFSHTFLGGRSALDYNLSTTERYDRNSAPGTATGGAGYVYNCTAMRDVWNQARCMNFNDQLAIDDFFDFAHYANATFSSSGAMSFGGAAWDPRSNNLAGRLTGFTCTADPRWQNNNYRTATNDPALPAASRYLEQAVAANLGFFGVGPASCTGAACCPGAPIPTGVQITRGTGTDLRNYMEFICVNPGCAFQRGGNGTSTTPQATGTCTRNPPQ